MCMVMFCMCLHSIFTDIFVQTDGLVKKTIYLDIHTFVI